MSKEYFSGLGLLVTLLLLLRSRSRQKEEERKNDQSIPPYEPIEPESRKLVDQTMKVISKASRIYSIVMGLLLLTVVGYLFFADSITRWIILGTAALIGIIILIHKRMKARQNTRVNDCHRREGLK
jgi:protein-S-isoprenylcysteine O-methyltransferase Ste14